MECTAGQDPRAAGFGAEEAACRGTFVRSVKENTCTTGTQESTLAFEERKAFLTVYAALSHCRFSPLFSEPKITSRHVWRVTSKKRLPHVCVYLAWALCGIAVLTSAFFTFMYRSAAPAV